MRIYRVGGSVRDQILGREPKDNDFVVVGATVEDFLKSFPDAKQIGQSFPVFLVEDKEHNWKGEFAFARRERKVGAGHNGFEVVSDPSVTLEDDLSRRDLTCNAIALNHGSPYYRGNFEDNLHDPFGGVQDINNGILRHVGPAFVEDPLRVFRVARFAAQLGWRVAPETLEIMRAVPDEEILMLSAERVGEELRKAMRGPHPALFIANLHHVGKLWLWFPELAHLDNVPAGPVEHHAEGSALVHTILALYSLPQDAPEAERIAVLFHDLGKGITPASKLPAHPGHDEFGVPLVEEACARLKLPNDLTKAAVLACQEHMRVHVFLDMKKGKMADMVKAADATILKAEGLARVCQADAWGRLPKPKASRGAEALAASAPAARAERGHPIPASLEGANIGLHIRSRKGSAMRRALHEAKFLPRKTRSE